MPTLGLQAAFPSSAISGTPSRAFQGGGAPWSSRHRADRAHLTLLPKGSEVPALLSGLWEAPGAKLPEPLALS